MTCNRAVTGCHGCRGLSRLSQAVTPGSEHASHSREEHSWHTRPPDECGMCSWQGVGIEAHTRICVPSHAYVHHFWLVPAPNCSLWRRLFPSPADPRVRDGSQRHALPSAPGRWDATEAVKQPLARRLAIEPSLSLAVTGCHGCHRLSQLSQLSHAVMSATVHAMQRL